MNFKNELTLQRNSTKRKINKIKIIMTNLSRSFSPIYVYIYIGENNYKKKEFTMETTYKNRFKKIFNSL